MKIVKNDRKHGVMIIKVESADDLWHLEHIITPGDFLKTRTMRKVAVKAGGEFRLAEKKPMVLGIGVEKKGFDETTGTLRVAGKIMEGPSDTKISSYHTIEIEPGSVITLGKKSWGRGIMKRIEDSRERQPRILLCVMDRDEADVAFISGTGIKVIGKIECDDPEDRVPYHSELLKFLSCQEGYDTLVIAGPGFEAGNFLKYSKEKGNCALRNAMLESASHTGINGINEVIKRSGERILRESRIGKEVAMVEEVLSRIKTDGLVTYGREEVRNAVNVGAVETLVVSREKMSEFEDVMESCEKMRGSVSVVTADHSLGEQFLHLGGIAALLRFRAE